MADEMHVAETETVDEREQCVSIVGKPRIRRRQAGAAMAEHVDGDDVVALRQLLNLVRPDRGLHADPMHEKDRRAPAAPGEGRPRRRSRSVLVGDRAPLRHPCRPDP